MGGGLVFIEHGAAGVLLFEVDFLAQLGEQFGDGPQHGRAHLHLVEGVEVLDAGAGDVLGPGADFLGRHARFVPAQAQGGADVGFC